MKGFVKCIIAGAVILGIGIAVLIVALAVNGWKFDWSFRNENFEMKSYEAQEDNSQLNLDFQAGQIEILFYEGEKIKIDFPENNRYTCTVTESDGALTAVSHKLYFFDCIGWGVNFPKTTVYIPQDRVISLNLELNAGSVTIADGIFRNLTVRLNAGEIKFGSVTADLLNAEVNAGTLNFENIDCPKTEFKLNAGSANVTRLNSSDINVKVNAGGIKLYITGAEQDYTVSIERNAGSCNIENRVGVGNKNITGKVNAGGIEIYFGN